MPRRSGSFPLSARSFTLLEVLIAMTIVAGLFVLLARFTGEVTKTWTKGVSGIERRQNARDFLDFITTDLQFAAMPRMPMGTNSLASVPTAWIGASVAGSAMLTRLPLEQFVINPPGVTETSAQAFFFQSPVATDDSGGNLAEVGYCVSWIAETNGNAVSHTGLLRRLLVNTTSPQYLLPAQTNWITDAVIASAAPADVKSSYQGRFAEDVYALWARALDAYGNPIVADATGKSLEGYAYDSRLGYTDSSGGLHPPGSLPAMVEVAIVAGDAALSRTLAQAYPAQASRGTAKQFWSDISGYVATLPTPVQNKIHIYSTRIALLNAR
ncbi:MAG TPA: hypothetical protein VIM58_02045 [Candidatus Methylacidiphilales bacterium]